jgi:hypothetical protein
MIPWMDKRMVRSEGEEEEKDFFRIWSNQNRASLLCSTL